MNNEKSGGVGRLRRRRTATVQTTVGDCAFEELLLWQEKLLCCGSKLTRHLTGRGEIVYTFYRSERGKS